GLNYMQQRYYDPNIGRFLSTDPVTAYEKPGQNFNRYWYANNNPYKFTDPDGRCVMPGSDLCGKTIETVQAQVSASQAIQQESEKISNAVEGVAGKMNAASTTAIGYSVGSSAAIAGFVTGTDVKITFDNNAIQFENVPDWIMPGAITIGNAIIYGESSDPTNVQLLSQETLGKEEMQHTIQAESLGPLYLPAHAVSKMSGYLIDGKDHGPADFLERNPHSREPRP
ncbi:RHS repeat-associated core domain-containing protein, partial [Luteimonas panaciterrae]|uniref:RHS repeat-associated core domain-containing protein n=1 Tax=Luteimonas panaciterrae TaxID=363885 RepID=UPI001CFBFE8A